MSLIQYSERYTRPIWSCLESGCQEQLRKAQWKWHRRKLTPPGDPPDIMAFDPEKEMSQKPQPSREAMR